MSFNNCSEFLPMDTWFFILIFMHLILGILIKERANCKKAKHGLPKEARSMFTPDTLGFDKIYVLNLSRRPERKRRLEKLAKKMRLKLSFFNAVDGRLLNQTKMDKYGVHLMPKFVDPFSKRPMTYGEIGCFLGHYFIWEDIIMKKLDKVLILEDDAAFRTMFRKFWSRIYADIQEFVPNWDMVYLGRKRMESMSLEKGVNGTNYLIWPGYSYWAVAYALSQKGAKKLLQQKPLQRMIPVDEYLPIMFNRHPDEKLKEQFTPRDLVAVSTSPLLIEPAWFPKDKKYVSDTESSNVTKINEHTEL